MFEKRTFLEIRVSPDEITRVLKVRKLKLLVKQKKIEEVREKREV